MKYCYTKFLFKFDLSYKYENSILDTNENGMIKE